MTMSIALVFEVDPDMAGFLKTALKQRFDKVIVVAKLEQFWQLLLRLETYPTILLIDVGEHYAMGHALLEKIRQTPLMAHLPVVLTLAGENRRRQCAALVNQDDHTRFLVRPFTYQELNSTLDTMVQPARRA